MLTFEDFHMRADWEGGLAEFILGYGVREEDVPPSVYSAIQDFEAAFREVKHQLDGWQLREAKTGQSQDEETP